MKAHEPKCRVVHIVTSIEEEAAGPSYSVPALARTIAQLGHSVRLQSQGPVGVMGEGPFEHRRFHADWQTIPRLKSLRLSRSMARDAKAEKCDLIHAHGIWQMPFIYAARAKSHVGAKLVLSPRGMFASEALKFSAGRKRLFSFFWQNKALAKVDMFHATSEQEYRDIRTAGFGQPVLVVPNGIDVPATTNKMKTPDLRTLLYFGRIHPIKFIEDLLLAWQSLQTKYPDWSVRIVGPGLPADVERIRGLVTSLGLQRISLEAGVFGDEKWRVYQSADLYVLPSRSENFAMTIAEALAAGVPSIATRGAPWAAMVEKHCGWSTDFGAEPLGAAIRQAFELTDRERTIMGANGRAWMLRDYSWTRVAQDVINGYQWLISGGEMPVTVRIE